VAGAAYNYYFEDKKRNIIDLDLQYKLVNTDGGFTLNPLAGIRIKTADELETDLIIGFFSVLPISDYHFYLEPKFVISKNDAFVLSAGFKFYIEVYINSIS